jgi:lipopolysaccharide export system permease protein
VLSRFVRPLDRYVFSEWAKIFVTTALGFPILVSVIDLTDNLSKYLNRNLPRQDIALSYLYWFPDSMFMVLPAAVLFATVFSIGSITRHSEITAAKASGISFYRVIAPIFLGAFMAVGLSLGLGEIAPRWNAKRQKLLQESAFSGRDERFNFTYAAEQGRVYKVGGLAVSRGEMQGLEIERKGVMGDSTYPTYVLSAQAASYKAGRGWMLRQGNLHILPDSVRDIAFSFDSVADRLITERPINLMSTPKAPQEMGYQELGAYIRAMERSGGEVNVLRVERMLKLAIPATCVVILLFGAPLATSTQRGGAAYGIGISLGTTIIFLMLIQLTKAIGGKGIITPELAAWLPSVVFGLVGTVLFIRVRT